MSILQLTQTVQVLSSLPSRGSRKRPVQQALPGMESEQEAPRKISNRQIAEVLAGIADMIEAQNGNPYRIQAYRHAARGILDLPEPAADIIARGEPLPVPGLGERLRSRIAELVQLGSMTFQSGLFLQTLPTGVRALMAVEHIGPYTALRLYDELGIDSPDKLWWAAHQQRIRQLPGFGPRSEARLKAAAEQYLKGKQPPERNLGGAA
ncbi:MAG: histidinol-phosphatase [Ktedonobacteraceae bacterium]|nr:histidinol-phosphatase [Ktedonobacteraceae bacterium]